MKSVEYFQKQWPNQPENLIFVRVFVAMHGKLWSHWNVCIKHAKKIYSRKINDQMLN